MEVNRKKLMYAILREINNQNYDALTPEDFEVNGQLFHEVIGMMVDNGFISGYKAVPTLGDQYTQYVKGRVRIEYNGIEFLEENSPWAKTYNGLKEIRDWLPF